MESIDVIGALSALAQDTRLAAFRLLVQHGPSGLAAGEIAEALDTAPATLSFHLKELANAGLVTARQEGRFVYYSAHFEHMNRLLAYLTSTSTMRTSDSGRRRWKPWSSAATCGPCRPIPSPRRTDTWQLVPPPDGGSGIYDIHSGAEGSGLDGRPYRDW